MSPDVHALTGAYALDALTGDERAFFERHLAGCDHCRREVDGFAATAALLGAATARLPPARLRPRVLELGDATRQLSPERTAGPGVHPGRRRG
ncbi:MAG TPA: zf-HC2 domain-containing protein, partial [Egibacteraceae bacterium]|nr:zf-HC2 domain-containing protein [Egibacteraceae bacterium]